jgi:hypothetical protein
MGMPQLIVTAVLVEVRSKSEVAHRYGVSRRWVVTRWPGISRRGIRDCSHGHGGR